MLAEYTPVPGMPLVALVVPFRMTEAPSLITWAAELKDRAIRVNVISPGSIETALFNTVPPEFREQIISAIPLGRLGTSQEIAAAALFFASSDASFITGANLVVDGGFGQI